MNNTLSRVEIIEELELAQVNLHMVLGYTSKLDIYAHHLFNVYITNGEHPTEVNHNVPIFVFNMLSGQLFIQPWTSLEKRYHAFSQEELRQLLTEWFTGK